MPLSETDKAYIAGLFDGEGCISIGVRKPLIANREKTPQYCMQVKIDMCSESLIRFLHSKIGYGSFYVSKKKNPKHNTSYSLSFSANQSVRLFNDIKEYLILKKQSAILYLEFCSIRSKRLFLRRNMPERQQEIYMEIKKNNRRGTSHSSL